MTRFLTILSIFFVSISFAQNREPSVQEGLNKLYQKFKNQEQQDSVLLAGLEETHHTLITEIDENGEVIQLIGFAPNGHPIYLGVDNVNASKTVGTNLVVAGAPNGYGLTGNGIIIGEWDGGEVRGTHQEFSGRVTQVDNPSSMSDHSTHVCGTMIAAGVMANAKGMATAATVQAHDFYNDQSEMTTFATTGLLSNHSYGTITGWRHLSNGDWRWYGDTTISATEDYRFGFYSSRARNWDLLANAAPNYLIVKSAGNDRNDGPPPAGTPHEVSNGFNWVNSTAIRPKDGGIDGFDCISSNGNAKNILTVGAVSDIVNGWTQASDVNMSSFSGWGPTDDGRIKPDIVANGVSLRSSGKGSNTDYYSSSGTSMSAPNTTGSLALLQEMYNDSNASYMNASTLKALVIHTANEAGNNPGPDFSFGWGLLNIKGAADAIADTLTNKILASSISNNNSTTFTFYADGTQNIEATIVWNDPAGTPTAPSLDPATAMLIHDLDLRISNAGGTTKMPWILNSAMPSLAATRGDNVKDNVEKVIFDSPTAGTYTFTVSHKGTLGGTQNFSLIVSGVTDTPATTSPVVAFTGTPTTICAGDTVQFTDNTSGNPTSLEWTFAKGLASSTSSANPFVIYDTAGTYTIKLKATNAFGNDSLTKTGYITVLANPTVTLNSFTDACIISGLVPLSGGSPTGGIFSGVGVTGSNFDPTIAGAGTHTVFYQFTDANSCSSTDSNYITVTSTVQYYGAPATACDGDIIFRLPQGSPAGGMYAGFGVVNDTMFDPVITGLGSFVISYTDPTNLCALKGYSSVHVTAYPVVTLDTFRTICLTGGNVTLTGGLPNLFSGYYFGTGVTGNILDPTVNGAGIMPISYIVDDHGCADTATQMVEIGMSTPTIKNINSNYCINQQSVVLKGDPLGGIFSGSGISDSLFSPNVAGIGIHTIAYITTGSCAGSFTYDVMVNPKPTIEPINGPLISSQNTIAAYHINSQNGAFYTWTPTGGSIVNNANNQVSVLWGSGSTGFLEAVIHDQNTCMDTTNVTVVLWPVGIENISMESTIKAFPNPVVNTINFAGESLGQGNLQLTIYSLNGKKVIAKTITKNVNKFVVTINTSMLSSSTYFYQFTLEGELIGNGNFVKQ